MPLRLTQLLIGLVLYGVACGVMVEAGIGLDPWTVFAQGLSLQTGIGIGWVTNLIGFAVLLLWIPLRQRPGIGTLANILVVGTSMQVTVDLMPAAHGFWWQLTVFVFGMLLLSLACAVYIGARLGPGPRDGLMTGIHSRLGWPIWLARLIVEASVLLLGWLLGGTVGLGTVLFAIGIGPLIQIAMRIVEQTRSRMKSLRPRQDSNL